MLTRALILAAVLFAAANPVRAESPAWPAAWVVIDTPHSYGALVERLNMAVAKHDMGVVFRASATSGVKKLLNEDIPGNAVIGVFRADYAKRMLAASIPAGIEAPVRYYITENGDGTATLSYAPPSVVFAPYDDGGAALDELAAELDGVFAAIAKDATAN
jgi:uncharacterized protein (DUF302 family)